MDTREVAQQYRLNQWIQRIRECRSSGQKIADWCAEHGFSEKTCYYWLKRVRKQEPIQSFPVWRRKHGRGIPCSAETLEFDALVKKLGTVLQDLLGGAI